MRIALLIQLLFVCIASKAQVEIIPAVDTSLYIGIENHVSLKSGEIPLEQLKLRTSTGAVSGDSGRYIILCSAKTSNALLEVIYKNKVVASKKVNVNTIGNPAAYAVGESAVNTGNVSKKQLESLRSLITKCNPPLINFTVVSFTVEIIHNGQSRGMLNNSTEMFDPEIKLYLKYAEPGDEIIFDSIRVKGTEARARLVPPIKLKVI